MTTDRNQPVDSVIEALNELRNMADTKTIIGDPINVNSTVTIIPVSKVSVGLGIGGGNNIKKEKGSGNSAAGASGLTVTPVAFLIIDNDGETKLLNVGENTGYDALGVLNTVNSVDKALDKAPDIIEKVKALFTKNKKSAISDNADTSSDSENTEQ